MFSSLALPRSILSSGFLVNDYADLLVSIQFPIAPLLLSTCSSGPHPFRDGRPPPPRQRTASKVTCPTGTEVKLKCCGEVSGFNGFHYQISNLGNSAAGNSASKTEKETSIKDNYTILYHIIPINNDKLAIRMKKLSIKKEGL